MTEIPKDPLQSLSEQVAAIRTEVSQVHQEVTELTSMVSTLIGRPVGPFRAESIRSTLGDGWLTLSEAAKRSSLSPAWMRQAANQGLIPGAQKISQAWIIPEEGLEKFVKRPSQPKGRPKKS